MSALDFLSGLVLGVVIVAAYLRRRQHLQRHLRPRRGLDDEAVERIIREGVLRVDDDEPLDLDAIDEAERRFWSSEGWDPAED